MISSVANPTIKRVRRLRKRAWRERTGRFIVEGRRAIACAAESGVPLEQLLYTSRAERVAPGLLALVKERATPSAEVSVAVMAHLTSAATAPALLGVAAHRDRTLASVPAGASAIVLDGVHDPATAGGVMATAAAAGFGYAVAGARTVDLYRGSTVRAAAGAHFRLGLVRDAAVPDALAALRERGARVVRLGPGGVAPWDADLRGPLALCVGDDETGEDADLVLSVPSATGTPPGLGARTAVVLYEWVRQGRQP